MTNVAAVIYEQSWAKISHFLSVFNRLWIASQNLLFQSQALQFVNDLWRWNILIFGIIKNFVRRTLCASQLLAGKWLNNLLRRWRLKGSHRSRSRTRTRIEMSFETKMFDWLSMTIEMLDLELNLELELGFVDDDRKMFNFKKKGMFLPGIESWSLRNVFDSKLKSLKRNVFTGFSPK